MKQLVVILLSLSTLSFTYYEFSKIFIVDTKPQQEALGFIYQHVVQNFKPIWNLDWKKLDAVCSKWDINSYLHPDTILTDKYLFNFEKEYIDKQIFFAKIGFIYARFNSQIQNNKQGSSTRNQGLQSSVWSYSDWFSYQTCAFEKKMRMPLIKSVGKSKLNQLQNEILTRLSDNGATEDCLKSAKMLNIGYSLDNPNECISAMQMLLNKEYIPPDAPMKYLQKSDSDRGTGVWPLQEKEANDLLNRYQNGSLCGNNTFKPLQLQEFVTNPLLLNIPDDQGVPRGHMFVFRVFFVAASAQPLIIYIYDSTSVFICVHPYNKEKFNHYTHFCHNKFANQYKDEQGLYGEEALKFSKSRDYGITFQEFTDIFIAQGVLPKGTTAQEFIYSRVQEKISFYFTEVWKHHQDSRFGQWSAFDVIINDRLEINLLEMNIEYTVEEKYPERGKFLQTLQFHKVNLMIQYVRQRYLRIKNFMDTVLIPAIKSNELLKRTVELKTKLQVALTDVPLKEKVIEHYWLMDLEKGLSKCKPYL